MKQVNQILSAIRRRWAHFQNNHRIQVMARKVQRAPLQEDGAPVLFFNATTRLSGLSLNAGFSLLTSWAIRSAGVPVMHFVCDAGMSRCVLGTRQDDPSHKPPCTACKAQSRVCFNTSPHRRFRFHVDNVLNSKIKDLSLAELETFVYEDIPLGQLVLPSLRWILRRHHLLDDEPTRYLFRQYIISANNVAQKFLVMLESVTPRCVVVFNGQFFPEATVRYLAMKKGIRVIAHEVGLMPFCAFFTEGEATAYPIDIPEEFELNEMQNARLDGYLSNRFRGHFSMAGIQFWPEIRNLSPDFIEKSKSFKQVVPVFTNVVFDTSQGHANTLFSDMFSWLDEVFEVIKRNPETLFVIRAHPDELRQGKESRESVAAWASEKKITDLPNVFFINATEYFSSYELIQLSKFVMVYNSTIGMEASILGKPVLCAGKARFTQLDTVFMPQDKVEYVHMLEEFLDAESLEAPAEHRINARKFLYYQLFCSSLPFSEFLEEDRVWRGYVKLKQFPLSTLTPEGSQTIRVILDGILKQTDFLLEP
jgi:hypothetical protein